MNPKVTLVDYPRLPAETIHYLWEVSRHNGMVPVPEHLKLMRQTDKELDKKITETFHKVVDSSLPVAENLWFVFLIENVSISFREQMVRHRIGVKVGERFGVDMFPDIHDSTWWSQGMRHINMGKFASDCGFRMPESLADAGIEAAKEYTSFMHEAERVYNSLVEKGVPIEDAREVIPMGATHRVSWGLNLSAIIHILKKRSCWILQLGVWEPVVMGMIQEMAKLDPYFSRIVTPPCMDENNFKGCVVKLDNERRIEKKDPMPPCSLYLHQEQFSVIASDGQEEERFVGIDRMPQYQMMKKKYRNFWGRDVESGMLLK